MFSVEAGRRRERSWRQDFSLENWSLDEEENELELLDVKPGLEVGIGRSELYL